MAGIDNLLSGDLYKALTTPFINAGISSDILFLLIIADALALIYMKNKSIGLISLLLILVGSIIPTYVAVESQKYFMGFLLLGIISMIYGLFK